MQTRIVKILGQIKALLTQPLRERDLHCFECQQVSGSMLAAFSKLLDPGSYFHVESGYYYFHCVGEADTQRLRKLPEVVVLRSLVEEPGSNLARLTPFPQAPF